MDVFSVLYIIVSIFLSCSGANSTDLDEINDCFLVSVQPTSTENVALKWRMISNHNRCTGYGNIKVMLALVTENKL